WAVRARDGTGRSRARAVRTAGRNDLTAERMRMTFRTLCRRALAATAGLGLAGFCLIAVAAPAGASTNIDQKATGTHCSIKGSPYLYCLTYAVNETGGLWASEGASTSNLCVSY